MSNYQALMQIPAMLPEAERTDARKLVECVAGLELYVDGFKNAIALFDYAETELKRTEPKRPTDSLFDRDTEQGRKWVEWISEGDGNRMFPWLRIACREGALQIYHFGRVIQVVRENLRLCPAMLQQVDVPKLQQAMGRFETDFPQTRLIRHAVAHSPHETMFQRSSKKRTRNVGEGINGRAYMVIKDGLGAYYFLDAETLQKLEYIRELYVSGFADLMRQAAPDLLLK